QTLSGANTYTGSTQIGTDGTLSLGDGGASGSIASASAITNNGALIFNRSNVMDVGNVISGTGTVNQIGTGTTTLTATNTYTGATKVTSGTLALSGAGSIAGSSSLAVGADTNFSIAGTTNGATVNSLSGLGNVALGESTLTLNAGEDTFGGVISGNGALTLANGKQTLSGANTYIGTTSIVGKSTLLVEGSIDSKTVQTVEGGTLGGSGTLSGAVSIGSEGSGTLLGVAGKTLTMGELTLGKGAVVDAVLGTTSDSSLFQVNGALTLGGTLNVAAGSEFGVGVFKLADYSGTLTNNGLTVGKAPEGTDLYVQTSVANRVNVVNTTGQTLQFWDGDSVGGANRNNNVVDGGNGTWTANSDNWTTADGFINAPMKPQPGYAIFQAAGGKVDV
ncbi:MAG: autotransporter protein, partial [Burkholderiales bacterium]